jgi:glycosyltransferase involved in cell wall biosynthesis
VLSDQTHNTSDTTPAVEVSVVIPCLNEADTLEACVRKAQQSMAEAGIAGEVVVADNGSTDESPQIAERLGARVVNVKWRGYGSALMGGIEAARGELIVMGDADDSYDFLETARFIEKLRDDYDLVQGCRLPSGGGTVMPGAMPFLHRWIGNPILTRLVRIMFKAQICDVYCGMRAFRKSHYQRLKQRCTGMEFATEMIIKSNLVGARIAELPITLYPDGRKAHQPHLRTFRDGWRTLVLFMMFSPRWTYFMPGLLMILCGLLGYALAMPGLTISGATLDAHTLLFANAAIMIGYQAILFAVLAKVYSVTHNLLPTNAFTERVKRVGTLERMLLFSAVVCLFGVSLLGGAVWQWWQAGFGSLDYARTMRWVIPGVLFTVLGFQSVLAGFFLSILRSSSQRPAD